LASVASCFTGRQSRRRYYDTSAADSLRTIAGRFCSGTLLCPASDDLDAPKARHAPRRAKIFAQACTDFGASFACTKFAQPGSLHTICTLFSSYDFP
jgi:hypothetical protein